MALVSDRVSFFASRYTSTRDGQGRLVSNSSIVRLDCQSHELQQFGFGPQSAERTFHPVALSDDGSRLFAVENVDGAVCVWRVPSLEAAVGAGEAPLITPMQVIQGMQGEEGKEARKAFAAVKGLPLPTSMFVLPEERQ